MEYKIYRYNVNDDVIFIDLFNEEEQRNIEINFRFHRRARHLKLFLNYIEYHYLTRGLVTPADHRDRKQNQGGSKE